MTGLPFAGASAQLANTTYLWIWVVIGIVTIAGSAVAVYKWAKQQGVKDEAMDNRLELIEKQLKPNGLNTDQVGDVVKRTENAVGELGSKLDQHIGAELQARREMWRAINGKQNKEQL